MDLLFIRHKRPASFASVWRRRGGKVMYFFYMFFLYFTMFVSMGLVTSLIGSVLAREPSSRLLDGLFFTQTAKIWLRRFIDGPLLKQNKNLLSQSLSTRMHERLFRVTFHRNSIGAAILVPVFPVGKLKNYHNFHQNVSFSYHTLSECTEKVLT